MIDDNDWKTALVSQVVCIGHNSIKLDHMCSACGVNMTITETESRPDDGGR